MEHFNRSRCVTYCVIGSKKNKVEKDRLDEGDGLGIDYNTDIIIYIDISI